jgi:SAM-dependent methyltransferase
MMIDRGANNSFRSFLDYRYVRRVSETDYLSVNRAWWHERVGIHLESEFYDVAGFRAGGDTLRDFEPGEVGDVSDRTLVHLQCHFGLDTLSWARRGARVTGLDFSAPATEAARAIAEECGIDARFVTADVYDAVEVLGETYDIVYTGLGALNWLPDIRRWAEIVVSLLKPDGFLYLAEFHPFSDIFDEADGTTVRFDYFGQSPLVWEDAPGTYAQTDAVTQSNRAIEYLHPLGDIVSALIGAGLRVEFLHEYDYTLFPRFTGMRETKEPFGKVYRLPSDRPRIPLMYSLRATHAQS